MNHAAGGGVQQHLDDLVRAQGYDLVAALVDGDVGDGSSMTLQQVHPSHTSTAVRNSMHPSVSAYAFSQTHGFA